MATLPIGLGPMVFENAVTGHRPFPPVFPALCCTFCSILHHKATAWVVKGFGRNASEPRLPKGQRDMFGRTVVAEKEPPKKQQCSRACILCNVLCEKSRESFWTGRWFLFDVGTVIGRYRSFLYKYWTSHRPEADETFSGSISKRKRCSWVLLGGIFVQ